MPTEASQSNPQSISTTEADIDRRFATVRCAEHKKGFKKSIDPKNCVACGESRRLYRAVRGMTEDGWMVGEIATELGIEERTVYRIKQYLGMRTQAVKTGPLTHKQRKLKVYRELMALRKARTREES